MIDHALSSAGDERIEISALSSVIIAVLQTTTPQQTPLRAPVLCRGWLSNVERRRLRDWSRSAIEGVLCTVLVVLVAPVCRITMLVNVVHHVWERSALNPA